MVLKFFVRQNNVFALRFYMILSFSSDTSPQMRIILKLSNQLKLHDSTSPRHVGKIMADPCHAGQKLLCSLKTEISRHTNCFLLECCWPHQQLTHTLAKQSIAAPHWCNLRAYLCTVYLQLDTSVVSFCLFFQDKLLGCENFGSISVFDSYCKANLEFVYVLALQKTNSWKT